MYRETGEHLGGTLSPWVGNTNLKRVQGFKDWVCPFHVVWTWASNPMSVILSTHPSLVTTALSSRVSTWKMAGKRNGECQACHPRLASSPTTCTEPWLLPSGIKAWIRHDYDSQGAQIWVQDVNPDFNHLGQKSQTDNPQDAHDQNFRVEIL